MAQIDADEKVGVVNNLLHSLFRQVDVLLKERQVTQATGTYTYKIVFGNPPQLWPFCEGLPTLRRYQSQFPNLFTRIPCVDVLTFILGLFYKGSTGKMDVADSSSWECKPWS